MTYAMSRADPVGTGRIYGRLRISLNKCWIPSSTVGLPARCVNPLRGLHTMPVALFFIFDWLSVVLSHPLNHPLPLHSESFFINHTFSCAAPREVALLERNHPFGYAHVQRSVTTKAREPRLTLQFRGLLGLTSKQLDRKERWLSRFSYGLSHP
jgi:hypothetical protein